HPEVDVSELLVEHLARPLRPPEVEPGEHREHNGAEDHVVEVRDHEVGIRYLLIKGGTGQDHTGEPTEEERGQESDRPHDGRLEGDRAVPHRDRKSTRLNSSHVSISYAVFCL